MVWCGVRLSQPLGYSLAGLTRHDRCIPGCGTEAWFSTRSTRSLNRSVCVRAVRAGIQIQSWRFEGGRGSCRRWTGFRRDWKIRSIHPSTHHFVVLLLFIARPPSFLSTLIHRSTFLTVGDKRRSEAQSAMMENLSEYSNSMTTICV